MDVNLLKYLAFIKTVEYGSFTRAAELLNYSQSGISRMIHDLEKEWKVSLLERSRAGVRLTSEGVALLPYAKKLCADYHDLQNEVDALNGLHLESYGLGPFPVWQHIGCPGLSSDSSRTILPSNTNFCWEIIRKSKNGLRMGV